MTEVIPLIYSPTNTYAIRSDSGHVILVDTGFSSTLSAFYKAIKENNITLDDMAYIIATHYHPDHIGLISTLMDKGIELTAIETQKECIHAFDTIPDPRSPKPPKPIDDNKIRFISTEESRQFLRDIDIAGEIISIPSHSPDSIAIILDDDSAIVGDLLPWRSGGITSSKEILDDWRRILAHRPSTIYYGHAPAQKMAPRCPRRFLN